MNDRALPDTVAIVGAGAIGTTLAQALHRAGVRVTAVASHNPEHAAALAARVPGAKPAPLADAGGAASIVLLTVSDSAIEAACEAIGATAGAVVAHTSGSRDVSALRAAADRGALTGGIHPLAAVVRARALGGMPPDECATLYRGAAFAIEGGAEVRSRLEPLALALGGRPFPIAGADKPLYHLGASMLAAFSVGLAHLAWERMRAAGAPAGVATAGVAHLLGTVSGNVGALPAPAAALTGPAARGDMDGVRRQARAVMALSREAQALYRAHVEYSLAIAESVSRIDPGTAATLRAALRDVLPDIPPAASNTSSRTD